MTASTNNCSDIASDAPTPGAVTGSVLFVNAGAGDFHLQAGDTVALGAGLDLSVDPVFPFTLDIDGQTRPGTWDLGADEYVSPDGGYPRPWVLFLDW